jgi:hypothetical protein
MQHFRLFRSRMETILSVVRRVAPRAPHIKLVTESMSMASSSDVVVHASHLLRSRRTRGATRPTLRACSKGGSRREENPNPKTGRHEANEPERGCVGVGDQPQRVNLAAIQDAAADAPTPHTVRAPGYRSLAGSDFFRKSGRKTKIFEPRYLGCCGAWRSFQNARWPAAPRGRTSLTCHEPDVSQSR